MNIIPWKKELELGIEIVDNQHLQFLKRANKFVIMFRAEKKSDAAFEELEFMEDYLQYHFQTEETFQYDSGYPGYLEHQAEHKALSFKVKEMALLLRTGKDDGANIEKFAEFVNKWVVGHVLKSDIKFAEYYKRKKEEEEQA